jgi:hypothetical protein
MNPIPMLSRREVLCRIGGGFGAVALSSVFAQAGMLAPPRAGSTNPLAPKDPHFPARAKRLIFLFMNGGPSHVDTFDPKPALARYDGKPLPPNLRPQRGNQANRTLLASPFTFKRHGQSGIEVSQLFPEIAKAIDDICVLRGVHTDTPNHEPGLLMMNSGNMQPIRPSLGSWVTYALGSENQNLPGFGVLCPGRPVVGP